MNSDQRSLLLFALHALSFRVKPLCGVFHVTRPTYVIMREEIRWFEIKTQQFSLLLRVHTDLLTGQYNFSKSAAATLFQRLSCFLPETISD